MIFFSLAWLLQDFIQVFTMGIFLLPNIFLILLIFMALLPSTKPEKLPVLIWIAFAGGLFWDLRWTNLPGLTAAANSALLAASCILWRKSPAQARSVFLFTVLTTSSLLLSGLVHFIFWTMPSNAAIRQFLVQQITGIPVIALISLIFWRVSDRHA